MAKRTQYLNDLADRGTINEIRETHFGVNYVAGINSIAKSSNFRDIIAHLSASSIRYPGGTVTEKYFQPGTEIWKNLVTGGQATARSDDNVVVEGPSRFLAAAAELNLEVQFVLPTSGLVTTKNGRVQVDDDAVADVAELVKKVLAGEFGSAKISHFEIGNEYYYFADLSAKEYAAVADALVPAVNAAIEEAVANGSIGAGDPIPRIAVQAGAGWLEGDNQTIIDGLSNTTLDLVDSIIFHYYPDDLEDVDQKGRHFAQFADWQDATQNPKLTTFVSEWNVHGNDRPDLGMAQASSMISAFETLVEMGADTASVWGAQFKYLQSGLSRNVGNDGLSEVDTRLTASGEIIASMRESLVGLSPVATDIDQLITSVEFTNGNAADRDIGISLNSFGTDDRAVFYISSRSDRPLELQLDLNGYFGDPTHVWAEVMTSVDDPMTSWADEASPIEMGGWPLFEILGQSDLQTGSVITLDPYDIIRVSVQLDGAGVEIRDHNPLAVDEFDYDDTLEGSDGNDRLVAHIGNDEIYGRGGADAIRLGEGNDFVAAGRGNDVAFGDKGSDFLHGESGDDELFGGSGRDFLFGGEGADLLVGGGGNDSLSGGSGSDVLWNGAGDGMASGGKNGDYFVITPGSHLVITDFEIAEGDSATFLGQFESRNALAKSTLVIGQTQDYSGDLVFIADDGHRTIVEGLGDDLDGFLDTVVDFQPEGQGALELSDDLNAMKTSELHNWIDSLTTEQFQAAFGSVDPIILFANLNASAAGALLNSFDNDDLSEIFSETGEIGILAGLSDYSTNETASVLDTFSLESAKNFAEYLGESNTKSLLDGLSEADRLRLEPKFLSSSVQEPSDNEPVTLSDILPTKDAEAEADQENEQEEQVIDADCFIATAVYRDGNHEHVWFLRWFRDAMLRQTAIGRLMIAIYWALGPKAAECISRHDILASLIKRSISGLVYILAFACQRPAKRQPDHENYPESRKITLKNYRSV